MRFILHENQNKANIHCSLSFDYVVDSLTDTEYLYTI